MSVTGNSIVELRELIKEDVRESEQLQTRIDELRQDIRDSKATTKGNVLDQVESQSKKMSKHLGRLIEDIEDKPSRVATDREYLQALNARQVAWDRQIMQIAELADLMYEARKASFRTTGGGRDEHLEPAQKPSEGKTGGGHSAEPVKTPVTPASELKGWTPTVCGPSGTGHRDIAATAIEARIRHTTVRTDESQEDEGVPDSEAEEDEEEPEPDKSAWPLCYRIIDIDPATDPYYFDSTCKKYVTRSPQSDSLANSHRRAYRKLSLKHDPKRLPNDTDAPARWAAITKAYSTLSDPERRKFYDMHGRTPVHLVDFDLSRLDIQDR